ncbi:MAG: hypothetical protein JWO36_2959 [Myxococcales bacterium]|nr:hypothetical protein [Myxococcales bacterium]
MSGRSSHRALAIMVLSLVACGDDDDAPPPKPPGSPGGPPAATAGKTLEPRAHVEEQVRCAIPEKPDGPECKVDNPTCEPGKYCLQFNDKYFCEPCPERDSIRHEFRDRDFVAEQARDPFQSFVLIQPGTQDKATVAIAPTPKCTRGDQFVATNYSFADLKLVGIVAKGTERKVLMLDSTQLGHIIRRGDCVGKEKAVVKDIGTGYVTFQVEADPVTKRATEEHSVQLHPAQLNVDQPMDQGPPAAPTVAPPVTPAKTPRGG